MNEFYRRLVIFFIRLNAVNPFIPCNLKPKAVKKHGAILLFLSLATLNLIGQNALQGFEGTIDDNWNYTTNIPFYNLNGNTDLWVTYSDLNGRIDGAYKGLNYFAGRDLDNPYSEGYTGQPSPEHILTFETLTLNGAPSEISLRLNYIFLDSSDYIFYELMFDNGTSWNSPDVHVDVFKTNQSGKFSTNDWIELTEQIPPGNSHVRFRIGIYQNGNSYIGLDSFQLLSFPLSINNNTIEGFTFGPNPTNGILKLKANVILDKATLYDISGKKILTQNSASNKLELDISHLSSGIYITEVESQGLSQTIKVVKN